MSYRKSKILFLPGVFLSDCPDTEDEDSGEVLEISLDGIDDGPDESESVYLEPKVYDELQTQYINRDLWKKKTNLRCWACGLRFDEAPYAIPIGWTKRLVSPDNLDDQTEASDSSLLSSKRRFKELPIMEMHGNFCHEGCAAWYIMKVEDEKISNRQESMELLVIFHNDLKEDTVNHIPLADPRNKMTMYSGSIGVTMEKFLDNNYKKLENYKRAVEKSNTNSVRVFTTAN
jgi:hypothetical protein